jgi:hypothetical protein
MKFSVKVKKEYSSTSNSTFPYAFKACIKTILQSSSIVCRVKKIITLPPPKKKKFFFYLSKPLLSHKLHCVSLIADLVMYLSWSNFICFCIWENRVYHIKCGQGLIEIKWNVICVCVWVSVSECVCKCMCEWVCVCECVYVCECVSVCDWVCVWGGGAHIMFILFEVT